MLCDGNPCVWPKRRSCLGASSRSSRVARSLRGMKLPDLHRGLVIIPLRSVWSEVDVAVLFVGILGPQTSYRIYNHGQFMGFQEVFHFRQELKPHLFHFGICAVRDKLTESRESLLTLTLFVPGMEFIRIESRASSCPCKYVCYLDQRHFTRICFSHRYRNFVEDVEVST